MTSPPPRHVPLPRLPHLVLRALLPRAERDEVLADVAAEFGQRAAAGGADAARRWLWRQALGSAPALLGWSWWRGWTGFEPRANAYRPGGPMLKSWIADLRYAARRLRVRPTYTILSVLTLALGIGGTAAVFGIARGPLMERLPYANADRALTFWNGGDWTEAEFTHLRGSFPGFRAVAAHRPTDVTLREGESPARLLPGISTSHELFDVLGVRPLVGRALQPGDDVQGAEPVAVISWGLWQELGGTPDVVGRRLAIDGAERTVVGVMPRGFWYPEPATRIWLAQAINPERQNGSYTLVGHLNPGVDAANMQPQLTRITEELRGRFTYSEQWDKTRNAALTPLRETLLGSMRPALVAMLVAMGLILLIASANVAALMLGQVEGRSAELAVRSALGANRNRLTQQLVAEAALLGALAGVLGAAFAAAGFGVLARALPIGSWAQSATFDWTLFGVALAIALGAAMLVALVPTASLWRGELRGTMNSARMAGIQGRGGRLEHGLVVVQVGLAMLIASGAALLVRSVENLYAIEPGVRTEGVAVVDMVTGTMTSLERRQALEPIIAAAGEIPGVRAAAVAMKVPLRGGGDSFGLTIEGRESEERQSTYFRIVTPAYFETMGIHLRDGRTFDRAMDRIDSTATPVVVVNEAFARKYFPGENPIGRRVGGGFGDVQWTIIGVVADVKEGALTDDMAPVRYYMGGQAPLFGQRVTLVAHTGGDPAAVLDPLRRVVQRMAPGFAVQETTTLDRVLDTAVGPARQIMTLLMLLTGLALVLGAVGIYGVIAHFALRRRRDWAVRIALGLPTRKVIGSIVGQGASLVGAGIVVGLVGALLMARVLASFLFGVGTVDLVSFAMASAMLLGVGLVAAFIPARRTSVVSPAVVLREQ